MEMVLPSFKILLDWKPIEISITMKHGTKAISYRVAAEAMMGYLVSLIQFRDVYTDVIFEVSWKREHPGGDVMGNARL